MKVQYQDTMKLQISLVNLIQGDNIIMFGILMKTPTQKKEKQIITSMKDGEQSIQRISLQKTVFGDRLFANFSKEEQLSLIHI